MKTQKYTPKADLRWNLQVVDDDTVSEGLQTDSSFRTKKGTFEKSRESVDKHPYDIRNELNQS